MASEPGDISVLSAEEAKVLRPGSGHYRSYVGPPRQYDFMGATQFRLLTGLGLREEHYVLDVGCGSLRAGRLLLAYLLPGRYHGLEPNAWLIDTAVEREIGEDIVRLKQPVFSQSPDFDYGEFGRTFDFIIAQSIFSHTGQDLAERALSSLPSVMHEGSLALVTFIEARQGQAAPGRTGWVYPECVEYEMSRIFELIGKAGLSGQRLPWFHPRQTWYLIATRDEGLLTPAEIGALGCGAVLRDPRF